MNPVKNVHLGGVAETRSLGRPDGRKDGLKDGRTDGRNNAQMDGRELILEPPPPTSVTMNKEQRIIRQKKHFTR